MGTIGKTVKAIAPFAKVAGPIGLAYDVLRSEPAVASTEVPPGGYFYESQAYPSMAVEEGYPNVSTLPSFDVTPDAGGAIGGIPGVQPMEKYGPSGYEGERIPPEGFRQIAPDTVIAASDFDVGPTSMAMVGSDPALQAGDDFFGDGDVSGDYSQALADAGMAEVPNVQTSTVMPGWPRGLETIDDMIARQDVSWAGQPNPDLDYSRMFYNDMYGTTQEVLDDMARLKQERQDALDATAAANVDDFSAIPITTVTPRVSKAAQDKEKARMRNLAAQQRKDELARQKAAAKEKRDTAKRVAALARQAAARQAQAAREVQASKDRVRQANAIMNSRDYQEGGIGNLSAAQRDVLAAAQVDTFAGISDPGQGVRDAMRDVGYGGPNWT